MTNPSAARRPATLLLVLATLLVSVTRAGESLAAPSPSPKAHRSITATPRQAPPARSAAHPHATTAKAKQPGALAKGHRKAPATTRLAAKSKTPKRAHQRPTKPAKSVAKNPKHSA